jgi:hypothetical protein
MLRLPQWRANVWPMSFRPDGPALAPDLDRRATLPAARASGRPVAAAFAASFALHGALALVVVLALGGSGSGRTLVPEATLRATLATPVQKFAAPEPAPAVVEPAPAVPSPSPQPKALVPAPLPPAAPPADPSRGEGRLIVQVAEPDEVPDPAALAGLLGRHSGAVRVVPDFEVDPASIYPKAALAERRQLTTLVLAIVHDDGRVEVAPGTFEDPLFGASARAALLPARARPPEVDGRAVTGWALLRFYYEYVGAASAAAPAAR